jgi:uncharacterized protein YpmB
MKKIGIGVILGFILVSILFYRFYVAIHAERWAAEQEAAVKAIRQSDLLKVNKVYPFVGEQSYMVVSGNDEDGRDLMVWIGDDGLHSEYMDDNVSASELKSRILQQHPEKRIVRIQPGKLGREYVWEVFYLKKENKGDRYYYDFYRLSDGSLVETYTLSRR